MAKDDAFQKGYIKFIYEINTVNITLAMQAHSNFATSQSAAVTLNDLSSVSCDHVIFISLSIKNTASQNYKVCTN